MGKQPLLWATPEMDVVGNAFGYANLNRKIKKHAERYFDYTVDSEYALTITSADHFNPIPGKKNVLFTMWEFLELPMSYITAINRPDVTAIIVPCTFCKTVFQKYTDKPIYVCKLGVEADDFQYHQRAFPKEGERFRYLWLGAPNPRKGYLSVMEAIKLFHGTPQAEIYIKTTAPKTTWRRCVRDTWAHREDIFKKDGGRWNVRRILNRIPTPRLAGQLRHEGKYGNIIFDTRKLPFDELKALYNSAHAFLFPTLGEGWGLTLNEAMATGLPCIATPHTGVADFFDERFGYPIKCDIKEQVLRNYDLTTHGYVPDTEDFIRNMIGVYMNYGDALKKGEKASRHVLKNFTWENSGWQLSEIMKKIVKDGK